MAHLKLYVEDRFFEFTGNQARELYRNIEYALRVEARMTLPVTLKNDMSITFKTESIHTIMYKGEQ